MSDVGSPEWYAVQFGPQKSYRQMLFGDPDVITELDVIDPETTAARSWVRCENCDDMAEAIDMAYQHDGSWLCVRCDRRHKADWEDYMSTARGW